MCLERTFAAPVAGALVEQRGAASLTIGPSLLGSGVTFGLGPCARSCSGSALVNLMPVRIILTIGSGEDMWLKLF